MAPMIDRIDRVTRIGQPLRHMAITPRMFGITVREQNDRLGRSGWQPMGDMQRCARARRPLGQNERAGRHRQRTAF